MVLFDDEQKWSRARPETAPDKTKCHSLLVLDYLGHSLYTKKLISRLRSFMVKPRLLPYGRAAPHQTLVISCVSSTV